MDSVNSSEMADSIDEKWNKIYANRINITGVMNKTIFLNHQNTSYTYKIPLIHRIQTDTYSNL